MTTDHEPPAVAANPAPEERLRRLAQEADDAMKACQRIWNERPNSDAYGAAARVAMNARALFNETPPDVILALLDERDAATKTFETAKKLANEVADLTAECAALRASLEEEKARLDAISVPGASTRVSMRATENRAGAPMKRFALASIPSGTHASFSSDRSTLRAAIDAARGSSEKGEP